MYISIFKAGLASCNFQIIKWQRAVVSEVGRLHVFIRVEKVGINALGENFILHSLCHMWKNSFGGMLV